MSRPKTPPEPRFWAKVDRRGPDECWPWTGSLNKDGYGSFVFAPGHSKLAHRIVLTIVGQKVPKGLVAMHTCDNPPCVNPAHLRVGTMEDNQRDMKAKGRAATGDRHGTRTHPESRRMAEANPSARLTWSEVREIRAIYAQQRSLKKLATRYHMSRVAIYSIVRGDSWKESA